MWGRELDIVLTFGGDDAVGDEFWPGREDIEMGVGDIFACDGAKGRYCDDHDAASWSAVGRYVLLTGGGSTLD